EYEAPQGEVEEAIAAIWAELLKLQRVGRRDHFFELGGHSLLLVQMHLRVSEAFAIELSLRELLETLELQTLADLVTRRQLALYQSKDLENIDRELQELSEAELLAILAEGNE
ncbi:phosphopantetheine-binding protein, partial [Paucibacter sp. APW11]